MGNTLKDSTDTVVFKRETLSEDDTERIKIEFDDHEYAEGNKIEFIKASGLVCEDSWIYDTSNVISEYEKRMSKNIIVLDNLQDKHVIEFHTSSNNKGILYNDFRNDGMIINKLIAADDIVLEISSVVIVFTYPCKDRTTFTIVSENDITGFSRKELALKIMRYYHMMYYMALNYDLEKGAFDENFGERFIDKSYGKRAFAPIAFYEYIDNGIINITYEKGRNEWIVNTIDHI